MTLLDKLYSWEELNDVERDVIEAIQDSGLDAEFKGTIRIVVSYVPDEE